MMTQELSYLVRIHGYSLFLDFFFFKTPADFQYFTTLLESVAKVNPSLHQCFTGLAFESIAQLRVEHNVEKNIK